MQKNAGFTPCPSFAFHVLSRTEARQLRIDHSSRAQTIHHEVAVFAVGRYDLQLRAAQCVS
ncbi:hypothetical protein ACQ5SK_04265 [Bradyrhizobium japonicum]